jgi:hypothetical protein
MHLDHQIVVRSAPGVTLVTHSLLTVGGKTSNHLVGLGSDTGWGATRAQTGLGDHAVPLCDWKELPLCQ